MEEQKKILESKTESKVTSDTSVSKIIEDKVVKTKLNGYYVDQPIGKKAKTIEIVSFMTLVPKATLEGIQDSIARHFGGLREHTHSFALAFFSVARDLFPEEHSSLCINVDDELTDIAIVRHDAVVEHISIPIGNNALIRAIADNMAIDTSTANSTLRVHESDKLDKKSKDKIAEITEGILSKWFGTLKETCISLAQELQAPKTVFVLVNNQVEDSFFKKMKTERSLYSQNVDESLSIIPVDVNMLSKQCDVDKAHAHEAELYINTLFSNKLFRI
jgi:cell division ATPase FtsA